MRGRILWVSFQQPQLWHPWPQTLTYRHLILNTHLANLAAIITANCYPGLCLTPHSFRLLAQKIRWEAITSTYWENTLLRESWTCVQIRPRDYQGAKIHPQINSQSSSSMLWWCFVVISPADGSDGEMVMCSEYNC